MAMPHSDASGLVFGRDDGEPFPANTISQRAKRLWKNAGLDPITMHEARPPPPAT